MKRLLMIFLLVVFIPYNVKGKESMPVHELYERLDYENTTRVSHSEYYLYSSTYRYENGLYYIDNPMYIDAYKIRSSYYESYPDNIAYTCKSADESSCEELYAVYCGSPNGNNAFYSFIMNNGKTLEEVWTIPVSNSFHKEGEDYVLDNPSYLTILGAITFQNDFVGSFFCENRTNRCKELLKIDKTDEFSFIISRSTNDFVYGNGFEYRDGVYTLKGIIESKWPNYNEYIGTYTCMNNETTCNTLYYVTNYIDNEYATDGFTWNLISAYLEGTTVEYTVKTIKLEEKDKLNISKYMDDLSLIWVEDETIIKYYDDIVTALKAGTTSIFIKNNEETILLKIEVVNSKLINPNTSSIYYLILVMVALITIAASMIKRRKRKSMIQ